MKPALIVFSVLISLPFWFAAQGTPPPVICRGKSLPITSIPGPEKMTVASIPLRFGGTRLVPHPYANNFPSDEALRLVIKNRDEFSNYWKQLFSQLPLSERVPPVPEIDFSREMVVVAALGRRPGGIFIDGVCEADGQVEVFVSSINVICGAQPDIGRAPADAIRLPKSDLPVVFRETQLSCADVFNLLRSVKPAPGF